MVRQLASILVGDHLGQVKQVLVPSGEVSTLKDFASPSSSNPVVSIEPIYNQNKHLIANKNGELYIYDHVEEKVEQCETANDSLVKALPYSEEEVLLVYEKQVVLESDGTVLKQKRGQITDAKVGENVLAVVGKQIPLRLFDMTKKVKTFEADFPDKDWLGIQPETFVSSLDFIGDTRIVTCSKSDSVIRVYDTQNPKPKPVISIDIKDTAFNEHAESGRFVSVSSTGETGHSVVVGSNVGQLLAIDLRFNVKPIPKKKLQPRSFKILGGFKGARGATIKDVKIVPMSSDNGVDYKVISCCLDRYLRLHNFSKTSRQLDKHVYMKTKPLCCSPIFYQDL